MSTNPWQKVQEISTNLHDGLRRLDAILAEANTNVEKMMRNDLRAVGLENTPTEHLYDVWQRERAANVGQATVAEQHLGVVQKVPARREIGPDTLVRVNDGQPLTWAAFVGENEQSLHPMDVARIHGDLEAQGASYYDAGFAINIVERRQLTPDTPLRVDGVPMRWYQLIERQGGDWSRARHYAIAQALETVGHYGPVPDIRVVKALPPDAQTFAETIRVLLDFAAEDPPADVLSLDIIDVKTELDISGWPTVVLTLEDGTRFQLRVRRIADAPEVAR